MKIGPDCVPCILKICLGFIRKTGLDHSIEGPFPGTRVSGCSPKIQDIFKQANLVISKGGGNFDSLGEDKTRYRQKISFLFLSKCYLYEKHLHTPLEAPILSNYYD